MAGTSIEKMTPEERRAYERLEQQMRKLAARKKVLLQRASNQERKDADRRAIVTGKLLLKKATHDEKTRQALENLWRNGVEENMRYLFPEIWPEAKRPVRKWKKQDQETVSVVDGEN